MNQFSRFLPNLPPTQRSRQTFTWGLHLRPRNLLPVLYLPACLVPGSLQHRFCIFRFMALLRSVVQRRIATQAGLVMIHSRSLPIIFFLSFGEYKPKWIKIKIKEKRHINILGLNSLCPIASKTYTPRRIIQRETICLCAHDHLSDILNQLWSYV